MQGLVAILRDSLRVSTKAEQQAHAVCTGCCTSLVQGSLTPWCKVDSSTPEQQEPQAVCVAPAGCDVQWRGELLLIAQRPQSCSKREVREPCSATVDTRTGPRPALSPRVHDVHPLLRDSVSSEGTASLLCKVPAFGLSCQRQRSGDDSDCIAMLTGSSKEQDPWGRGFSQKVCFLPAAQSCSTRFLLTVQWIKGLGHRQA